MKITTICQQVKMSLFLHLTMRQDIRNLPNECFICQIIYYCPYLYSKPLLLTFFTQFLNVYVIITHLFNCCRLSPSSGWMLLLLCQYSAFEIWLFFISEAAFYTVINHNISATRTMIQIVFCFFFVIMN